MTVYGYARVSSNGQTLANQDAALAAAGVAKTYREKVSAVATRRPELEKVLRRLGPGDTLVVTKLDRLARSTRDLLNIIDDIAKAGAGFKSLGDAWADTTTSHGRLMLTVLGGIAEFARDLIRSRTEDGRKRARAAGIHMGRASALTKHQQTEWRAHIHSGKTLMNTAPSKTVRYATISRFKHGRPQPRQ
jgi:DNA invertase Pin-like site-specific DNA recombinase